MVAGRAAFAKNPSPNNKVSDMSLLQQSLRAFAAGVAVTCAVYAAVAVAAVPPPESRVTIDNFTFAPETITIPKGTKLEWENDDDIPHTVVETQGKFLSPALDTEDKYAFTFNMPGTYEYFCSLHPHMKGKVVVTP
jgi:plastocyanin